MPASTVAPAGAHPADFLGEEVIGTSAQGRPITASHRGTPGGTVVLVVGVIHGNENAGLAIVDRLAQMPLPAGIDLWLMPLMNPDGYANDVRGNGNGVDLNRNFPHDWTAIAQPGDWQYSGSGPASEPETQAYMAFTERIQPALTLWYHQDLYRVSPSSGPRRPAAQALRRAHRPAVRGGQRTGLGVHRGRGHLDAAHAARRDVVHRRARPHAVGEAGGGARRRRAGRRPDGLTSGASSGRGCVSRRARSG